MGITTPWSKARALMEAQLSGSGPVLVASDFDGTLSPIVSDPERAVLPEATQQILRVIRTIPGVALAFLSGRALSDLRNHVAIEGAIYGGNHGLEMEGPGLEPFIEPQCTLARPSLDLALSSLAAQLDAFPGVMLEDKTLSASVHYRKAAPELEPPLSLVVHTIAHSLSRVVVRRGKQVLELRPAVKWHKGHALRHMAERLGIPESRVIYLGDDTTDEDAFAFMPGAMTIQVGHAPGTRARFRAETLPDAREFLAWLANYLAKARQKAPGGNGHKP